MAKAVTAYTNEYATHIKSEVKKALSVATKIEFSVESQAKIDEAVEQTLVLKITGFFPANEEKPQRKAIRPKVEVEDDESIPDERERTAFELL